MSWLAIGVGLLVLYLLVFHWPGEVREREELAEAQSRVTAVGLPGAGPSSRSLTSQVGAGVGPSSSSLEHSTAGPTVRAGIYDRENDGWGDEA